MCQVIDSGNSNGQKNLGKGNNIDVCITCGRLAMSWLLDMQTNGQAQQWTSNNRLSLTDKLSSDNRLPGYNNSPRFIAGLVPHP